MERCMKVGLDFHGVIDADPEFFAVETELLIKAGHEIHIITGHEYTKDFSNHLKSLGIHWTHLFSMVSYHKEIGTKITYDAKGDPWMEDVLWNPTKADYCLREGIDLIIDDSHVYSRFFEERRRHEELKTAYLHFDTFQLIRNTCPVQPSRQRS
jgi:hypothetical protein